MTITKNCLVTLDYTLFDTHNTLIDSGANPLIYLHGGYGDVFESIEKALEGKGVGESIHLELSAKDAFGERQEALVLIEDRALFDEAIAVGDEMEMIFGESEEDELMMSYIITHIDEDKVVLDANHSLAGMSIVFDGTVIGVREATSEEIEKRLPHHEESLHVKQF
ncbi:MAG: peptidylprolyl isomerase [Epsilonproteobacteria bacterium]|nr:peptidylprolyl isomerase [Campylobacterota bacterium]